MNNAKYSLTERAVAKTLDSVPFVKNIVKFLRKIKIVR